MKKYFERMRGHEKFTTSLEISSAPPPPALIMTAPLVNENKLGCCAMFSCCSYYVISYEKSIIMGSQSTYASCVFRFLVYLVLCI
jgi:hypothetical protein